MSSERAYRFLDVGGTFVKCNDGRIVPIRSSGSAEEISDALRMAVGDPSRLEAVGVAVPGPFDFRDGIFRMDHKFAAVKGRTFRSLAGLPESLPVRYLHDVHAALTGAIRLLNLKGNTALVTLGTGLGFGFALHGEVQANEKGSPARNLYNIPCRDGILEDYVSARGIRNQYARLTGEYGLSALQISLRAGVGDAAAREAFGSAGTLLGEHLAPILKEYGIDTLLFGGQVSRSFRLMEQPARKALGNLPRLHRIELMPEGAVFQGLASLFDHD